MEINTIDKTDRAVIDTPQESDDKMYCRFCFNARIYEPSDDPFETPLTDENDSSSHGIGFCADNYCLRINAGHGEPMKITVEHWNEKSRRWYDIGKYEPKYCPECGRRIDEYDNEKGDIWMKNFEEYKTIRLPWNKVAEVIANDCKAFSGILSLAVRTMNQMITGAWYLIFTECPPPRF